MRELTQRLVVVGVVAFCFVLLFGNYFAGAFAPEDRALRAVEALGFTDVHVVRHTWFLVGLHGCDDRDAALFEVEGTNQNGTPVRIFVCSGWPFKGSTIRTE